MLQHSLSERHAVPASDESRVHSHPDVDDCGILRHTSDPRGRAGAAESDQRLAHHDRVVAGQVVDERLRPGVTPAGYLRGIADSHRPHPQARPHIGHGF